MSFIKYCRGLKATNLIIEDLAIPRRAKKSSKDIIRPEEIPMLFYSSETLWRGKPAEDFYIHAYRFAVLTGLRPGELIARENTNVKGNKITITQSINEYNEFTYGKNKNAKRTFYIGENALRVLKDQKEMLCKADCISRYVFPIKTWILSHNRTSAVHGSAIVVTAE